MHVVAIVVGYLLNLYVLVLLARAVIGWVMVLKPSWRPHGPGLVAVEGVFAVTDPPVRLFGRLVKPVRMGPVALDFGFLLTFVAVLIAQYIVGAIAAVTAG